MAHPYPASFPLNTASSLDNASNILPTNSPHKILTPTKQCAQQLNTYTFDADLSTICCSNSVAISHASRSLRPSFRVMRIFDLYVRAGEGESNVQNTTAHGIDTEREREREWERERERVGKGEGERERDKTCRHRCKLQKTQRKSLPPTYSATSHPTLSATLSMLCHVPGTGSHVAFMPAACCDTKGVAIYLSASRNKLPKGSFKRTFRWFCRSATIRRYARAMKCSGSGMPQCQDALLFMVIMRRRTIYGWAGRG